jgi:hypothetical protein
MEQNVSNSNIASNNVKIIERVVHMYIEPWMTWGGCLFSQKFKPIIKMIPQTKKKALIISCMGSYLIPKSLNPPTNKVDKERTTHLRIKCHYFL